MKSQIIGDNGDGTVTVRMFIDDKTIVDEIFPFKSAEEEFNQNVIEPRLTELSQNIKDIDASELVLSEQINPINEEVVL